MEIGPIPKPQEEARRSLTGFLDFRSGPYETGKCLPSGRALSRG